MRLRREDSRDETRGTVLACWIAPDGWPLMTSPLDRHLGFPPGHLVGTSTVVSAIEVTPDREAYRVVAADGAPGILRLARLQSGPDAERLSREVEVLRRLRHPGIVSITDHGELSDPPRLYVATEKPPGPTLEERVAARGGLTPLDVVRLGSSLAAALGYAHSLGIIHRSLQPDAVLLTDGDRTLLSDFSLARIPSSDLTPTNFSFGDLSYAAPELLRGAPATFASDVYSLGALLRFALTGRPLTSHSEAEVVGEIDSGGDTLTRSTEAADSLEKVIDDCLMPHPEDRPAGMPIIERRLLALTSPEETGSQATGAFYLPSLPPPRRLGLLLVGLVVAAGVALVLRWEQRAREEDHHRWTVERKWSQAVDLLASGQRDRAIGLLREIGDQDPGNRAALAMVELLAATNPTESNEGTKAVSKEGSAAEGRQPATTDTSTNAVEPAACVVGLTIDHNLREGSIRLSVDGRFLARLGLQSEPMGFGTRRGVHHVELAVPPGRTRTLAFEVVDREGKPRPGQTTSLELDLTAGGTSSLYVSVREDERVAVRLLATSGVPSKPASGGSRMVGR